MFESNTPATPENTNVAPASATPVTPSSAFDTILADIRNPNGEQKYRSVQDALYALRHSQEYIPTIKNEVAQKDQEINELRNKLKEVDTLRETVEALTRNQELKTTPSNPIDEETIANLVGNQITAIERTRTAQANQRDVVESLSAKYGDKAKDVFYEKANQLGLAPEDIEALAARSPQAVKSLFNIGDATPKSATKSPIQSTTSPVNDSSSFSYIGQETHKLPIGASSRDYAILQDNAKRMVEEMSQAGLSIHDLTDPKVYFKYFGK